MKRERQNRALLWGYLLLVAVFALAVVLMLTGSGRGGDPPEEPPAPEPQEDLLPTGQDAELPETTEPVLPEWVTQDLLPVNPYSRPGDALETVNGVVVHYVGNPGTTAKQNRDYFAGLALSGETSASSNFIIGLDGEVLLCVPIDEIAYASNSRNSDTISIECCHPDETGQFTQETLDSLVKLLQWLADTYDLDREDIIRHYDVTGKICPKYYVDNPDAWEDLRDCVFD